MLCNLIFLVAKFQINLVAFKIPKKRNYFNIFVFFVEGGCDELGEAGTDPEAVHGAPGSFEAVPSVFQVTSFGCFVTIAYVATFEFN